MDYKEKVIALLNSQELSKEQKVKLESVFPELAKSEDERIRKALIDYFDDANKADENPLPSYGIYTDKAIAWLEKQGEQKSIWHNEDEEPQKDSLILLIMQSGTPIVAKIIEPNHTFNHGERWAYIDDLLEKQGEQNLANSAKTCKDKPKFEIGDKIRRKNPSSCDKDMQVARIEKDYYICNHIGKFSSEVVPFSKESSYELVEQKPNPCDGCVNRRGCINCENGELREIEQKPAWSKEDEAVLDALTRRLEGEDIHVSPHLAVKCLKSLKDRYTWKPSDEQMGIIAQSVAVLKVSGYDELGDRLGDISEQLKKLMEE